MASDPGNPHILEIARPAIHRQSAVHGDAELRSHQPRGDVGVRIGVDVRVDAQCDRRPTPHARGDPIDALELRLGFDVDGHDPRLQGEADFRFALADPGENCLGRIATGAQHPFELAARDDVEAGAEGSEQSDDGQVRVCLYRIADQVLAGAEGFVEDPPVSLEGGPRVDIARCPDLLCDDRQRDILRVQQTVPEREMIQAAAVRQYGTVVFPGEASGRSCLSSGDSSSGR